jgi:hypothetical protein
MGGTQTYREKGALISPLAKIMGDTETEVGHGRMNREQGDLMSLLLFFQKKERRLKTNNK